MAEYIEREALMVSLCKEIVGDGDYYNGKDDMQDQIRDMVSRFPAADVAPVRHGRWEKEPPYTSVGGEYKKALICSQCHSFFVSDGNKPWQMHNYCPNCGAKMDLED